MINESARFNALGFACPKSACYVLCTEQCAVLAREHVPDRELIGRLRDQGRTLDEILAHLQEAWRQKKLERRLVLPKKN